MFATSSRSLTTLVDSEKTSSGRSAWAAAAAATAGLVSGSLALTLCDYERKSSSKGGIRDPMTSYGRKVLDRESKEREESEETNSANKSAVQATSSAATATARAAGAAEAIDMSATARENPVPTPSEVRIEEATRKAKQHSGGLKVFSGNGNMSLSLEIARHLGINLGKATVGKFADGEVNCVIHENVRGKDVYIVQPTCPPVNDNLMELLLMVSTLRRASARRITVVIPYYGYARQDRKMQVRFQPDLRNPHELAKLMHSLLFFRSGPCPYFGCGCCSSSGSYGCGQSYCC
jgi:hypothetical protein